MKAVLLNNRYRILKTLGRGGFGETYLTEDTHMPSGRKCVLKQLKPIVKNPKTPLWMKERFQREAAILEELGQGSDRIPQLYAYFSEEDKFYLVQEWIEGQTLDEHWSQEGNLHRDEVRQILLQILPVLDYVHSQRIIHRDIKPENIILRQGDKAPFLIDFGAVKEAIATEINEVSGSSYSASIGTPGYMSSEQAAGRPIYSSDLYSLGLTMIFLLTGKAPHELETDPRNGEIIWREHASNLDSELAAILDQAIRFHPRDRFSTAKEMLNALLNEANENVNNLTGATLNISPGYNGREKSRERHNTVAVKSKKPKQRSLLANLGLFALITVAVAGGTFATGFAVISSLLRSPQASQEQADNPTPARQPDIFVTPEESEDSETAIGMEQEMNAEGDRGKPAKQQKKLSRIISQTQEAARNNSGEKVPDTVADDRESTNPIAVDVETVPEIDIPILTTGTSESQLVSTLGKPNSERRGWRPNSRVLVYYDVVPDRVKLSYQADKSGRIRQTDVALDPSVSLGAMQETLTKMLGGEANSDIKGKLRNVYNRQTNFSFFKANNLEGKVQRDSKDRVTISVWEPGFQ